jgi:hypothetical protein
VAGTRGKMTKPAIGPGVRSFSSAVLGFSTSLTYRHQLWPGWGLRHGLGPSLSTILKPTTTLLVLRFWAFRKLERWHSCNAKDVWVSILIIAHQDGVIRGHPLHSGASLPFSLQCTLNSKKNLF